MNFTKIKYTYLLFGYLLLVFSPLSAQENFETGATDSTSILRAKYDSIIQHLSAVYGIKNVSTEDKNTFTTTTLKSEHTEEKSHTIETISTKAPISIQTKEIRFSTVNAVADTPRTNKIKPRKVTTPKSNQPKIEPTESIDSTEFINTENELVDSVVTDDIEEEIDEDENEHEHEIEFDSLFSGNDGSNYWDILRDPNFNFNHEMIPANNHYPFDWDTVVINPYKVSLAEMQDTIMLKLKDSMDCAFHPPAIGSISSDFGWRKWARRPKFHFGVDVRMEVGDPVYAIFDGVVRVAKRSADYGYVVLIRHYNGLETLYAHFDQLLAYTGKPVRSGEIIGLAGSTGRSTGPHLHFEVRYKGEKIDPNKIIHFPNGSIFSDTLQIDKFCFSHIKLYKAQQTKLRSKYYVVKRGDTLGKIAYKTGVNAKQIARLNRITTKTKIKAGRRLRLR
ncbi:MAG: peptidoglycan DD-metalloendopeptidase family protein [Bacteroidia bacterium]|nr:peptidoglycan DD-metalloendopeptidase family protein [Bacteroidia bacterium]